MIVNRVDNIFYNTEDVVRLATFHAQTLGMPIRREQIESPAGLMWMEINVGGMELSFRRAKETQRVHPELEDFLELDPGKGATISFEIEDMEAARRELSARGVRFRGDIISCTDGKELISIFEDPFGRPVQLYEPRFASVGETVALASRATFSPAAARIGANLRNVHDLALSMVFYADDLAVVKRFYGETLELPLQREDENHLSFLLDGTTIEFRRYDPQSAPPLAPHQGGLVAVEVRNRDLASLRLTRSGIEVQPASGRRGSFRDIDGNPVELWERSPRD